MKSKRKLKHQILLYSVLIVGLMLFTILFFTVSNRNIINQYHSSYELYDDLGTFYEEQGSAHDYIKSYLYTGNEAEYESYTKAHKNAMESLLRMQSSINIQEDAWRIQLLMNILESYEEQADKVILLDRVQDETYAQEYDKLIHINDTIINTSDESYQTVTGRMNITSQAIEKTKNETQVFTVIVVTLSVFGVILYAWMIRHNIMQPIDELVNNMDEIKKGSFDFKLVQIKNSELEVLCLALQDLSDNIHQNIEYEKEKSRLQNELLIKENENLRKDELLATSELRILQNQINPHFLFNAMNMIYQQAILDSSKTTIQMIEKMTECMRYTLSQNARTTTVQMELNFVENYIYIQNKRFEGRIHFELDVAANITNIQIPSMIIEPLIDNAVKHGMANVETDGLVSICVKQQGDFIKIAVSDNGCGMKPEALEKLVMNDFIIGNQDQNIGLNNLSRRLAMYYGDQASITVNSVEDCGFDTLITIPV